MARVLIVEDEVTLLKNVERRLRQDGFEVLTAVDGAGARQALEGSQIDVVCLNIDLPDIDGFELLEEIRLIQPGLPAIIMSGSATPKNRARAERLGVKGFLPKPFRLNELTELVVQYTETIERKKPKGVRRTAREPVVPRVRQVLDRPEAGLGEHRRWRGALPLAALLAALVIGLAGGYMAGVHQAPQQVGVSRVERWLDEAANYYRLYARDDRFLIEIGAEETETIENRLGGWLNRELRVPDLSGHGLRFRGARLFALEVDAGPLHDAQPAALLVYDMPDSRPLGLCITSFPSEGAQAQTLDRRADMNLLYWIRSGYGHVLMGWAEPEFLPAVGADVADQLGNI